MNTIYEVMRKMC